MADLLQDMLSQTSGKTSVTKEKIIWKLPFVYNMPLRLWHAVIMCLFWYLKGPLLDLPYFLIAEPSFSDLEMYKFEACINLRSDFKMLMSIVFFYFWKKKYNFTSAHLVAEMGEHRTFSWKHSVACILGRHEKWESLTKI